MPFLLIIPLNKYCYESINLDWPLLFINMSLLITCFNMWIVKYNWSVNIQTFIETIYLKGLLIRKGRVVYLYRINRLKVFFNYLFVTGERPSLWKQRGIFFLIMKIVTWKRQIRNAWRLFQKPVVRTNFNIYVFTTTDRFLIQDISYN